MLTERNRTKNIISDIVYLVLVAAICYVCFNLFAMMIANVGGDYKSDIPYYVNKAQEAEARYHRYPLVLFRFLYRLTDSPLAINIYLAVETAAIFFANYFFIKRYASADTKITGFRSLIQFLSIALVFAGPIYVPRIHRAFYKGTFPIFAWHSPTQQMTTLFSVIATLCLFEMMINYEKRISPKWWTGAAVFFFLSAYAKPSYILDIVPAIVVVFIIELIRKNSLGFKEKFAKLFIMGLSLVPSGIYMIFLNYIIYERADRRGDSDIVMDAARFTGYDHIWIAVICSIAFPLVVMLFNLKKLLSDNRYQLIVLAAIMGLLQWGLLSESGYRSSHGNFSWGSTIGGYMLYAVSMGIAIENLKDKDFPGGSKWIKALCYLMMAGSLGLSLLTQIYYFATMYNGAGFWR